MTPTTTCVYTWQVHIYAHLILLHKCVCWTHVTHLIPLLMYTWQVHTCTCTSDPATQVCVLDTRHTSHPTTYVHLTGTYMYMHIWSCYISACHTSHPMPLHWTGHIPIVSLHVHIASLDASYIIASQIWGAGVAGPTGPMHALQMNCACITHNLSLIHIWRCRRSTLCRSRWSPYH